MPSLGCKVHQLKLHKLSAPGIFLISGLVLQFGDVKRALKSPLPLFLGLASISLVLPCLSCFLALQWPYLSRDLVYGVAVFMCMPTALSTGVQICTHYGGNPALALMLTVATNLMSIVTIPAFVTFFLGTGVNMNMKQVQANSSSLLRLDSFVLFRSLVKSILVPMVVGIALRAKSSAVCKWVDANKRTLSMLSACLLISVPLAELSVAVGKGVVLTYGELLQVAGLGLVFPLSFILFNTATARILLGKKVPEEIRRTVVVVSSLKTLPSAVMVIQKLQEIIPTLSGVALIPPMMFHIIQTILVSAYASNANNSSSSSSRTKE
jgi:sodium/bile acid cotransporter 7